MSGLIRLYPRAWRERYGDEFEALVAERPPTLGPVGPDCACDLPRGDSRPGGERQQSRCLADSDQRDARGAGRASVGHPRRDVHSALVCDARVRSCALSGVLPTPRDLGRFRNRPAPRISLGSSSHGHRSPFLMASAPAHIAGLRKSRYALTTGPLRNWVDDLSRTSSKNDRTDSNDPRRGLACHRRSRRRVPRPPDVVAGVLVLVGRVTHPGHRQCASWCDQRV
jgi:hypothetical protein